MTFTIDENTSFYEHDIKLVRKADASFVKMMRELEILAEHVEQDKLHLVEYKLSKETRTIYTEIKGRNDSTFKSLLEQSTDSGTSTPATNVAGDVSKNILGLINKFHLDNKEDVGLLSSDDTFKSTIPKNIGAEPSALQKITSKIKSSGTAAAQVTANFLQSIITSALQKMEKSYSQMKTDFTDAKKQGSLMNMIYSKIGPSLKIARRKPDGTIEYVNDSTGTGTLNWIKDFIQKNPKWTNVVVGILINVSKLASIALAGSTVGISLAVGVLVGLILRALVGRLKGEDWKTAIKKAAIVTGVSLIGGSISKGLFSYFKGGGFIDGAKSYFTGVPGADQVTTQPSSPESSPPIGSTDVVTQQISGLTKVTTNQIADLLKSSRPGGTTDLYNIVLKNKALYDAFKEAADESGLAGANVPEYIKTMQNFYNQGDINVLNDLKSTIDSVGGIPSDLLSKFNSAAASTVSNVAAGTAAQTVKESVYKKMIKKLYI